jgi:acyl dehydratase
LHDFTTILAKRPSESRPGWGLITARNWAINQNKVLVFDCETTALLERRAG